MSSKKTSYVKIDVKSYLSKNIQNLTNESLQNKDTSLSAQNSLLSIDLESLLKNKAEYMQGLSNDMLAKVNDVDAFVNDINN